MKRDDLQGIRGLAIGAVLAFHFFPKSFPNGYIGVDIFFVLSGFLMTMIFGSKPITSDSVYQFYFRRAKRILPLYLLIILVGCIFVFLVFPNTFISMNMDSAWNSIFLYHNMAKHSDNNMYFKMLNQADDIFTHTWSLCVEMQFYLLAPIIFFFLAFCKSGLFLTIFHLIIIITSLVNYLLSTEHIAFNSVFCRVWQFLIGSAVFFLSFEVIELDTKTNNSSELLLEEKPEEEDSEEEEDIDNEVIFTKPRQNLSRPPFHIVLSISLSFLVFMSFAPWTIPSSVLRITCTILAGVVILTGTLCDRNTMKNRVLVYIGDISYSLYLVHWPIYVYVKQYYENELAVYLIAIAFSIILAIFINETFEKWYLKMGKPKTVFLIVMFYVSIALIVLKKDEVSSFADKLKYGNEEKRSTKVHSSFENITLEQAIKLNKEWARDEYKIMTVKNCFPVSFHGFCEFNKSNLTGNLTLLIVGNSLAPNMGSMIYDTFKNHAKTMYMYSYSYCEILTVLVKNRCKKANDRYKEEAKKKKPDVLFLMDRPDKLRHPLKGPVENDAIFKEALTTLREYEKIVKKKIYILGANTPPLNLRLSGLAKLLEEGKNVTQNMFEVDHSYLIGLRRQEELIKRCSKCELIRISDVLFNGNQTKSYDEETKLGYYYNGLHITPFAETLIYPLFQNASDNLK